MATLPRDDDEGGGAILVFDRKALRSRYELECHAEGWPVEEAEERIWYRDVGIAFSLTDVIVTPVSRERRRSARETRARCRPFGKARAICSLRTS